MKKLHKITVIVAVVIAVSAILTVQVTAEGENYAEKAGKWILENLAWVFLVAGIAGAGFAALKRNVTGAIISLAAGALLFVVCFNPEVIKTIGESIKTILFG